MERVALKTFFCLFVGPGSCYWTNSNSLVGRIAIAGDAGDPQDSPSLPAYLSSVYNPVNSVTVNTCCNRSEEDINFQVQLDEIKRTITHLVYKLKRGKEPSLSTSGSSTVAKDCFDIQRNGGTTSGVYTITPEGSSSFDVYCDMDTDGGGWTVIQRRVDNTVDFYQRFWDEYKNGFGSLEGNHWLGNDHLFYLTNQKRYKLRVDMEDFDNATRYAVYDIFHITNESDKYTLTIEGYSGDAGDAMAICNAQRFSARDDGNGNNCPFLYKGGWWYASCHEANPNGLYLAGPHTSLADGIEWYQWKGYYYSLKFIEMKLRPY